MIEHLELQWKPDYLPDDFCANFIDSNHGPNGFMRIDNSWGQVIWNSRDNVARLGYCKRYDLTGNAAYLVPAQLTHYMEQCNISEAFIYVTYNSQERFLGDHIEAVCVPRVVLKYTSTGSGIFGTGRGEFIKYKDVILGDNFIQPIDNDYPAILCYITQYLNPMAQVGLLLELTINDVMNLDLVASNPLILG